VVFGYEELMMISAGGIVIRTPLETISERTGRATSGVILMNLRDGDRLAAIAILEPSANGNGDDDHGGEVVVGDEVVDEIEVVDEEALAAVPSQADVDASEADAEAEEDEDADEEDVVDTEDDAKGED
jgi:hypothetical protein